ncbi:MAG: SHOCT domain-containing protein, partial [Planctomycetota bacterium]
HLELEKADLLLDGGPHGSTIGGSSIQLDGTAGGSMGGTGGYELNMPPSGSMSGVVSNTSQTQMRELRELNDLKHSGQITNEEYRERKKEIYAGKSLAIQAMSRSADGSGNRPVLKADDSSPLLPKPVVLLIVLAVLGGAGYAGWSVMQGPSTSSPDVAVGPAAPQPAEDTTPEQVAVTEDAEEEAADDADESATPDELADGNEATGDELAAGQTDEQPLDPELAVTMLEVDHGMSDSGIGSLLEDAPDEPVVEMTITDWPTDWPVYTAPPDDRRPIVLANQLLLRMAVRDNRATLGVAVGPPAEDFDSPAYLTFRQEMQGMVTQWAEREGILENLNLRTNDRTTQLGSLEVHRLHVTAKGNRNGRATILTGIQDGYCVTYWFDGHESLYRRFPPTVGLAVFEPLR